MTKPKLSRERQRQLRNLEAGLCERCAEKRIDSRFCTQHRSDYRARQRDYMRKVRKPLPT